MNVGPVLSLVQHHLQIFRIINGHNVVHAAAVHILVFNVPDLLTHGV